jgi:hypothetical protein
LKLSQINQVINSTLDIATSNGSDAN